MVRYGLFLCLLAAVVGVQCFIDPFGVNQKVCAEPVGTTGKMPAFTPQSKDATITLAHDTCAGVWAGPASYANRGVGIYHVKGQGCCFVVYDYGVKDQLGAQFAITLDSETRRPIFQVCEGKNITFIPVDDLAQMWREWKDKKPR